ncbi:Hypothetical protein FKW44_014748 [Caligus rogercresseyi]|uniref:Uncharacterized protein n=1 Tax=Caligus rogercresseyi TaxID=217165 RepID=A0A7T8GZZ3_CALRO|nr:Hypothetical protein FKW44_014748 [Caligus rogercresseyi]
MAKSFNYGTEFLVTKQMTVEIAKAELELKKKFGHKIDFKKNINSYLQRRFPGVPARGFMNVRRRRTYSKLIRNLSEEQPIEETEVDEHLAEDFPCLEIAEDEAHRK